MFGVGIEMDHVFGLNVTGLAKIQVGTQILTSFPKFLLYNFLFHHCMAMNFSQFVHKFCFVNLFQAPLYNGYKLIMMTLGGIFHDMGIIAVSFPKDAVPLHTR